MKDPDRRGEQCMPETAPHAPPTVCIDWFAEGEAKVVEVDGVQITIRFIGRKGRRARIAIDAPVGSVFKPG